MKARTIIPLIIGLGVGFFAIKMGIDMVQKAKGNQGDVVEVCMSAQAIEVASALSGPMLTTKDVPRSLLPGDAFTDSEKLIGRVTAMSIARGIPITSSMLAPPGSEPGLRAKIPPGHRAVSIKVNEESAVAGFVMPGGRVDVFSGGGRDSGRNNLILSDVEVGAVGQSMSEVGKDGKTVRMTKSVTLFLKPDQVELLPSGRQNLRLALRGNAKDPLGEGNGEFWSGLLAKAMEKSTAQAQSKPRPSQVKRAPDPKQHILEVVRGSDVERLVFIETGVPGQEQLLGELSSSLQQRQDMGAGSCDDPDDPPDTEISE
ncbi:MAG: Flp pilus assembly protein CpaB [Phycisphaerae bacterium]|nr:Flp pilus assembly protein CpaB [Phycisphaerae bacterium]